jgi:stage V sporulation protein AF
MQAGSKSKTDIAICYMESKVDKELLKKLKDRISSINCESLTMSSQSLVEAIYPHRWFNPMPKVKNTERPDTTSNSILKGNIAIIVDNSPSALILPTSIFDILEEADDYYFSPVTGTYLRLARYLITFSSLFLTPVWLLLLQNPSVVPKSLSFILLDTVQNIPVFWQLLIIEVGIDGLRLASLNTPNSLTTPLSIIGAVALSDFAVQTGWCSYEAIVYMAFVTVANYTQPNYELGYSIKFSRIFLLIMTYALNVWGFVIGTALIFIMSICNRTLSGKSYLYPLIPFNPKALAKKLIRLR